MKPRPGIQSANLTPTYVILDRKKCPGYCWYYYAKDQMGNDTPNPIPPGQVIVGRVTNVYIKTTEDNMYLEDALQVTVKADKTYVLRTGGKSRQQGTVPSSYKGLLRSLYYAKEKLGELVAIETTPTDQAESVIFVNVYTDLVCDEMGTITSGMKVDFDYKTEEEKAPDPRVYVDAIASHLNNPGGYESSQSVSASPVARPPFVPPSPVAQPEAILPPQVLAANAAPVPVTPVVPKSAPAPQKSKEQVEYANLIKEGAKSMGWSKEGLNSFLVNKYNTAVDSMSNLAVDALVSIYNTIQDPKVKDMFCPISPPEQLAIPQTQAAQAVGAGSEIPF